MHIPLRTAFLTLALAACNGDTTDTDTTTPTGDTGTDPFSAYADADLTDPAVVTQLANNVSAPNVYAFTVVLVALVEAEKKSDCPVVTVEGDTTTYVGGCTDDDGDVWEGTATYTQTGNETGTIVYDAFGRTTDTACDGGGSLPERMVLTGEATLGVDGSFVVAMDGEGDEVDEEACTSTDLSFRLEYSGLQVSKGKDVTVWNGSGRYGDTVQGKVRGQTVDEVIDDEGCNSEAESGTTTMTSGGQTAVITYDGAVDCDPESTVTWTLDGADQGELTGIRCSSAVGGAGTLGLILAAMGLLGAQRRR